MRERKPLLFKQISEKAVDAAWDAMRRRSDATAPLTKVWVLIDFLDRTGKEDAERLAHLEQISGWDLTKSFLPYLVEATKSTSYEDLHKLEERLMALVTHMGHVEAKVEREAQAVRRSHQRSIDEVYEKY